MAGHEAADGHEYSRPLFSMFGHTTLTLVLLTAGYYLVPIGGRWGDAVWLLRLAGAVLLLAGLAELTRRYVARRLRRLNPDRAPALTASLRSESTRWFGIELLLSALYLLMLTFALAYAITAAVSPSQFVGIDDRTDALYFSVTLVSTVGLGDIHPTGTFGQLLATAHMLFNVIYLGTALRLLSARATPSG